MDESRAKELRLEEKFRDGKVGTGWGYTFYKVDVDNNVAMCEFRFPKETWRVFFEAYRFREFVKVANLLLADVDPEAFQELFRLFDRTSKD